MEKSKEMLERVYGLLKDSPDLAIDVMFEYVDDACLEGRFGEVDEVLKAADSQRLGRVGCVGLLSISLAAHTLLKERSNFYQRCLRDVCDQQLLKGLEGGVEWK